jgi:enterochelin esterase-like enzyme
MISRRTVLAKAAAGLTLAGLAAGPARAGVSSGRLETFPAMASRFVDPRQVTVWLPPGYDAGQTPHGVLYMHDGQNLFDKATAPFGEWGVDEVLGGLIAGGAVAPTLVVGVWNTPKRTREYLPADLAARLDPAVAARAAQRLDGPVESDGYLRFLVEELKPFIDARYRTRPERTATTIMGSSMGGLISLYAGLKHPETFGQVGCVSTHWPLLLADKATLLDPAWFEPASRAIRGFLEAEVPAAGPAAPRWWFDWGTEGLDSAYAPYQAVADQVFAARGYVQGRDILTRGFPGATHNEPSWRARLDLPLKFLLAPGAGPV